MKRCVCDLRCPFVLSDGYPEATEGNLRRFLPTRKPPVTSDTRSSLSRLTSLYYGLVSYSVSYSRVPELAYYITSSYILTSVPLNSAVYLVRYPKSWPPADLTFGGRKRSSSSPHHTLLQNRSNKFNVSCSCCWRRACIHAWLVCRVEIRRLINRSFSAHGSD